MKDKKYYSQRRGAENAGGYNFGGLKQLFMSLFDELRRKHYFVEALGSMDQNGYIENINDLLVREIGKNDLWLIDRPRIRDLDDLFDIIEFLYEHTSVPENSFEADNTDTFLYGSRTVTIYTDFNKAVAQEYYRDKINDLLAGHKEKYTFSEDGLIELSTTEENRILFDEVRQKGDASQKARIAKAIKDYKRSRGDHEAMHDAVRTLADILESLQKSKKLKFDRKDESDLFNIANNFGIRHADPKQKTNYDKSIWLEWMFFFYLASINAALSILKKAKG